MIQTVDFEFGGLSNARAEVRTPMEKAFGGQNCFTDEGVLRVGPRYDQIGARTSPNATDLAWGANYANITQNERQILPITGGTATAGAVQLTWEYAGNTYSSAGSLAFDATAAALQAYLYTLKFGAAFAFLPSDVIVSGGPWPSSPFRVTFTGRYAGMAGLELFQATDTLTGTGSPDCVPAVEVPGGDHEIIYAVVQHSGETDARLYAITSADEFLTTTWTSLGTGLNASKWELVQYFDKMLLANDTDGLRYLYIGATSLSAPAPDSPGTAPSAGAPLLDPITMYWGASGGTLSSNGFTASPTLASLGTTGLKCTLAGPESGNEVYVQAALAASEDWSVHDVGRLLINLHGTFDIAKDSIKLTLINADGTPVNIEAVAYSPVHESGSGLAWQVFFHFAGNQRYDRDNVLKMRLSFKITAGVANDYITVYGSAGSNWLNDTLSLDMGDLSSFPRPTKAASDYAMSYYRSSDGVESALSPIGAGPVEPIDWRGSYHNISGFGSTQLSASDYQWFYRLEKSSGKWRRLPSIYTKSSFGVADFGIANDPTGAADSMPDHWMEYEISAFPEPLSIGALFGTGIKATQIAVWKQCVAIGADRQLWLSSRGRPFKFAPSPDTTVGLPDPDDEERPSTEYVSDNRSEEIMGIVAGDSMYITTKSSSYTKIGDKPSDATVPRKLPGSRGALDTRATSSLGGGVMMLSEDGWWYYSVGRGVSGEDNGNLTERELTQQVRKSYLDLFNAVHSIECHAVEGSFILTVLGQKVVVPFDATAEELEESILALPGVKLGDVECWGGDLTFDKVFVRFRNQHQGKTVALMTADTTNLIGPNPLVQIEEVCAGGRVEPICVEFDNQLWAFNGNRFLTNTREQTWLEGTFVDKIVCVIPNRKLGFLAMTSDGKLVRIASEHRSDNGSAVTWRYHTGVMSGPRARVTAIEVEAVGTPSIQITMWDGEGRRSQARYTVRHNGLTVFPIKSNPGFRMRVRFIGNGETDQIEKCRMTVEQTVSGPRRL